MRHFRAQPQTLQQRARAYTMSTFLFILLGGAILTINVLQVLSLAVLPFSGRTFRLLNRTYANAWWASIVYLMERWQNVRVIFTGEILPMGENAVVIVNHQQMTDVTGLFALALRKGRLGDLKWFVKDAFKYVPGPGWGMLFLGNLFVKRNWLADRHKIDETFSGILRNKVPLWLINFLEGTRITEKKLKRSQEYCARANKPILKNLLAPRTKGFAASIEALRFHLDAVYDVTIGFPDGVPKIRHMMCGYISQINLHVRRFPIETIPTTEPQIAEWVWELFKEKDKLLDFFYQNRAFPGPVLVEPL